MVRIELQDNEAQQFLSWLVSAPGAWLVTNPVIMQLAGQLQAQQTVPAAPRPAEQRGDGIERAAP